MASISFIILAAILTSALAFPASDNNSKKNDQQNASSRTGEDHQAAVTEQTDVPEIQNGRKMPLGFQACNGLMGLLNKKVQGFQKDYAGGEPEDEVAKDETKESNEDHRSSGGNNSNGGRQRNLRKY